MGTFLFEKITLVGVGMMGASLSRAIRKASLCRTLCGVEKSAADCDAICRLELVDWATCDSHVATIDADLVILCTPTSLFAELAAKFVHGMNEGSILTDVGSAKAAIVRAVSPHIPKRIHFIPAHPVAGKVESGAQAGSADIFDKRWCILTPSEHESASAVARLTSFWEACGCRVAIMTPERHDIVLAATSHVPHAAAYSIMGLIMRSASPSNKEINKLMTPEFINVTRTVESNPLIWRDIFMQNSEAVIEIIDVLRENLAEQEKRIRLMDRT